eukprot:1367302-Amphidinium_carterae.1
MDTWRLSASTFVSCCAQALTEPWLDCSAIASAHLPTRGGPAHDRALLQATIATSLQSVGCWRTHPALISARGVARRLHSEITLPWTCGQPLALYC